jgi:putative ABC transport system permease protein
VFQSYNLIPHQTVLSNVELALTISGISRKERRARAIRALEEVGLGDQLHKRPNQMSGGQMQRVAIARALVNDPKILLADEPTGALDTETSVQVMELLKEVARDRLVVMVTHNPELAEEYATRIVRLKDGRIVGDTDPCTAEPQTRAEHRNMGKASMSFFTALALSFNNLRTKKARTFLTAFAGSIGIIGIAMILALSTGVNRYITDIQKDTMTSYPISIQAQAMDLSGLMGSAPHGGGDTSPEHPLDGVYSDGSQLEMFSAVTGSITENNLTAFKKYLDNAQSPIHEFVGENGIVYSYPVKFGIYTHDPEGALVHANQSNGPAGGNFDELLPGREGQLISSAIMENYEVLHGAWPQAHDEMVLVLNRRNEIAATTLYALGILPASEYKQILAQIQAGEKVTVETEFWSYEEICGQDFTLIPACDLFVPKGAGTFANVQKDEAELENLLKTGMKLKIVGVVRPMEDGDETLITGTFGYTQALTTHLIRYTEESAVVKAQKDNPKTNVLTGLHFAPEDDAARVEDARVYLQNLGISDKAAMYKALASAMAGSNPAVLQQIASMTEEQLAAALDAWLVNADDKSLLAIYDKYISPGTYEDNMEDFGLVSLDAPNAIHIYCDSFEAKDSISRCIQDYNKTVADEDEITYTDYVALLMSSVTTIVDVISYVLIAFVGVSLVVSSIMIGIITYISVLERTKEIGILRAIGASKSNISQVFNAETFIIGLFSGLLGIGITLLLLIPANAIIHAVAETDQVNAQLPLGAAVILVILSVVLTLIGGLIPAKKAARKDPVIALRTE